MISRCFRNGLFYEARYHGDPVCVFVGKDNAGKAKFACMRGITGNLKKDVYGSDKEFSFCYPPQNPGSRHVAVFEALAGVVLPTAHRSRQNGAVSERLGQHLRRLAVGCEAAKMVSWQLS